MSETTTAVLERQYRAQEVLAVFVAKNGEKRAFTVKDAVIPPVLTPAERVAKELGSIGAQVRAEFAEDSVTMTEGLTVQAAAIRGAELALKAFRQDLTDGG